MKKKFNLLCGLVFLSYLFSDGGLFAARVVNSGGSRSPNSRSSGRTTSSSSSSNSSDISGSVLRFLNSVHLDKLYYDESYSLSTMLLPSVYNYYYTNGTAKLDEKFCFGPYMKLVGMDSSGAMDVVSAEGEIKCVDLLPKYSYSVSLLNGTNSQISSVVDNSGLSSDRRKLYVTRAGNLIASMYLESEIFVDVSEYEKKINSAVQTAREKCGAFVNDMEKLKSQITYGVSLTSGVGSVLSTGSTVVGALSLKNTKDAIYYHDAEKSLGTKNESIGQGLYGEKEKLEKEVVKLNAEIESIDSDISNLEEGQIILSKNTDSNGVSTIKYGTIEDRRTKLTAEKDGLEQVIAKQTKERTTIKNSYDNLACENKLSDNKTNEENLANAKKAVLGLNDSIDVLMKDLGELDADNNETDSALKDAKMSAISKLKSQKEEKEKTIKELNNKINDAKENVDKCNDYKSQMDDIDKVIEDLKIKLKDVNDQLEKSESGQIENEVKQEKESEKTNKSVILAQKNAELESISSKQAIVDSNKTKIYELRDASGKALASAKDFDKWQVGLSAASSLASGTASVVSFVSLATIEDAITNLKQCEDSIRTLNNAYSSYNAEVSGMED